MQQRPDPVERSSDGLFVGRQHEIDQLRSAFSDAAAGRPRLAFLVGEPGIGKTSTAQEFADTAASRGALVLWGSCYEGEGAPAYWPWVQIVRGLMRRLEPEAVSSAVEEAATELGRLIPEISGRVPSPALASRPPDQARFRLFDAVAVLVRAAAEHAPLALILDDIHWADEPSLLLLEFLARELRDTRVLILATYRQQHLGRQHPLAQVLGRLTMARRLMLAGFGRADVERFIEATAGVAPTPSLVDTVHAMTGGNPFFLGEVVRLLASEGRLSDVLDGGGAVSIPQGVREVIGRRLEHVSTACNTVLVGASVVGREFGVNVLERLGELPRDELLELLAEAVEAGVVEQVRGSTARFAFVHALVRETLYAELTTVRRIRLHRQVGEALEELYGPDDEQHLAEMAHHFLEAAPGGDIARAIDYAVRSAARATRLLAYEESVRLYQAALDVLDLAGGDQAKRCDLLVGLGESNWRTGAEPAAWDAYFRAMSLARDLGDAERLGNAALGPGAMTVMFGLNIGQPNEHEVRPIEEALDLLGPEDSPLRVRLLSRLAALLYWVPQEEERRTRLSTEAVDMAHRLGDPLTLAYALSAALWSLWAPDNLSERLAMADEIIELSKGLAAPEGYEPLGHMFRFATMVEMGDFAQADAALEAMTRLAAGVRDATEVWFETKVRAMRAMMRGRLEEAERLANEAVQLGEFGQDRSFQVASYWIQMCTLRILQDRADELEPVIRQFVDQPSGLPAWRTSLAWAYSGMGRLDDARRELREMAAGGFRMFPRDASWVSAMVSIADVTADVGDVELAAEVYGLLEPYADRCAYIGPVSVFCGSIHGYLGRLSATLGRFDEAERHFEEALAVNQRAGAVTCVVAIQSAYGAMLLQRDGAEDRERAEDLLSEALGTAREAGLARMVREMESLDAPLGEAAPPAAGGPNVFRREGEVWTLRFGGETVRLKDTKGLRYLSHLLHNAGVEVHVLELVASSAEHEPEGVLRLASTSEVTAEGLSVSTGDGTDVLDARAKAEYRRRLEELREELEEAERNNDPERAARAQWEIDAIADQLAAGLGLGGRSRKSGSPAERARVNVRNTIASALRTIREHDEALWKHLSNSVRTGAFCSYAPERPVEWSL